MRHLAVADTNRMFAIRVAMCWVHFVGHFLCGIGGQFYLQKYPSELSAVPSGGNSWLRYFENDRFFFGGSQTCISWATRTFIVFILFMSSTTA